MELKGKKLNILGDSITEGVGASGPEHGFVRLLENRSGALCRNYGVAGTRIAPQHCEPAGDDFCTRALQMDPEADAVVVFGGTNDFGHGDAPLGAFGDRTPATFWGALHTLFTRLEERFPGVKIVVATPMRRAVEHKEGKADLCDYVRAIRQTAAAFGLPVLDLYERKISPSIPRTAFTRTTRATRCWRGCSKTFCRRCNDLRPRRPHTKARGR